MAKKYYELVKACDVETGEERMCYVEAEKRGIAGWLAGIEERRVARKAAKNSSDENQDEKKGLSTGAKVGIGAGAAAAIAAGIALAVRSNRQTEDDDVEFVDAEISFDEAIEC